MARLSGNPEGKRPSGRLLPQLEEDVVGLPAASIRVVTERTVPPVHMTSHVDQEREVNIPRVRDVNEMTYEQYVEQVVELITVLWKYDPGDYKLDPDHLYEALENGMTPRQYVLAWRPVEG